MSALPKRVYKSNRIGSQIERFGGVTNTGWTHELAISGRLQEAKQSWSPNDLVSYHMSKRRLGCSLDNHLNDFLTRQRDHPNYRAIETAAREWWSNHLKKEVGK